MEHKYIYTLSNYRLFVIRKKLRSDPGVYVITGESGTGKSIFLRDVYNDKDVLWLSAEKMKQMMIEEIQNKKPVSVGTYKYIVIDNIEDIRGEATIRRFSEIVDEWVANGVVIAMTECPSVGESDRIRKSFRSSVTCVVVKKVTVRKRIIKKYASLTGLKLSPEALAEISKKSVDLNSLRGIMLRYDKYGK